MNTEANVRGDEQLINAANRLTRIYASVLELNQEAYQIRLRMRDFDVNVEALNLLASARSRNEKGGGEQVLRDLISYARKTGVKIEGQELDSPPTPDDRGVPSVDSEAKDRTEHERRPVSWGRWKLLTQLVVAVVVTSGLFVLIH